MRHRMWTASWAGAALLGAALAVTSCWSSPATAAAPVRLQVGLSFLNNGAVPLWVARDQGLFSKYGIDAEIVLFRGGTQGMQALLAGQVPILFSSAPEALAAAAQGADVIEIMTVRPKMPFSLIVRPELRSVEELRGKAVGVSGSGLSASRLAMIVALRSFGLDPSRDHISLIPTGNETERLAALAAGSTQGTVLTTVPYAKLAEQRGMRVLYDLSEAGVPWVQDAVHTTRRFLSSNREQVTAFTKAMLESYAFILDPANEEAVLATIQRSLGVQRAEAEEAYQDLVRFVPRLPVPSRDALQAMLDAGVDVVPDLARVDLGTFVETSVLEELERSGFVDALF